MITHCEQDGADERYQQVERGKVKPKSIPTTSSSSQLNMRARRVADGDAEQPAGERDREAFGGEDAAYLAGAGADAAQDADLAWSARARSS